MPSDFFYKFICWTERFYLKDLEKLRMLVVKTSCYLSSFKSYGHLNSEKYAPFKSIIETILHKCENSIFQGLLSPLCEFLYHS
jgi:hypothetical protein